MFIRSCVLSMSLVISLLLVCAAAVEWEKNAILTVGNAGCGKSTLANILLKKDRFEAKYQVKQVTTKLDQDYVIERGKELIVMDIPGLLDSDPVIQNRNKEELKTAFEGNHKQIVLLIAEPDGGRLKPHDVATFIKLFQAYDFKEQTIIFVVNKVEFHAFETTETLQKYTDDIYSELESMLLQNTKWDVDTPISILLIEKFERSDFLSYNVNHDSTRVKNVRLQLLDAINQSSFHHNELIGNDINLDDEEINALKQQLDDVRKELAKKRDDNKWYANTMSTLFYPAIRYGESWGKSIKNDPVSSKWTTQEKTSALINRMCAINGVTGFTTAFAGQLGLVTLVGAPAALTLSIVSSIAATVSLQIALAAAVATIYDLDPNNPAVQVYILLVILGNGGTAILKNGVGGLASKHFLSGLRYVGINGKFLAGANALVYNMLPMVGRHFFVMEGTKQGFVRFASFVPFIGPLVSGVTDSVSCFAASKLMNFAMFQTNDEKKAADAL